MQGQGNISVVSAAQAPDVTIVMSPREQFSYVRRSIESLYADQSVPFDFICVDGGSPRRVRDYLRAESGRRNFRLIEKPYYLAPSEAKNLAIDGIKTRYTVFIDNDVVFTPGWLQLLINCAEETGAAVVAPLTCIGEPLHSVIHMAGGETRITVEDGKRLYREVHYLADVPLAEARDQLSRKSVELVEFHCVLVQTRWLRQMGRFDEGMKTVAEHTDFSMTIRQLGGTLMIEPRAIVTQIFNETIAWRDLKVFFYRWRDEWTFGSEQHFQKKWNLVTDGKIMHHFVEPRRRLALARLRAISLIVIGWRMTEWLFKRVENAFIRSAERDRAAATSAGVPNEPAQKIAA